MLKLSVDGERKAKKIAVGGQVEFWQIGDQVYRVAAGGPMDIYGLPMSRRWECSLAHWQHYRAIYDWVTDVNQQQKGE